MSDLFITEIESKDYNDLLESSVDFIDDILIYGQYLFDLVNTEERKKYSDSVILLLFRELLETLDGIKSLFVGSSINVSDMLIRNMFELTISLDYIFSDKKLIEKRALSYQVEAIHNKVDMYKKFNLKNSSNKAFKNVIGDDILNTLNTFNFDDAIKSLQNQLNNNIEYCNVNNDRKSKVKKLKNKKIKWYEIYSDCSNLRSLSKLVNMEKYYLILYDVWSKKTHGSNAMSGIIVVDRVPVISNPKVPKTPSDVATKLSLLLTFMSNSYKYLCTYFLEKEDYKNMYIWHTKMRKKEEALSEYWTSKSFTYV